MALLTADLVLVDVNDEFLEGRSAEDVIGHNFFEVFPKVPEDFGGHPVWTALEAAFTTGRREVDELFRYDIEVPGHPGEFQEHYWSAVVMPIRDRDGKIDVLELSVREVTSIVARVRAMDAEPE
jgi:hypothetical protein